MLIVVQYLESRLRYRAGTVLVAVILDGGAVTDQRWREFCYVFKLSSTCINKELLCCSWDAATAGIPQMQLQL